MTRNGIKIFYLNNDYSCSTATFRILTFISFQTNWSTIYISTFSGSLKFPSFFLIFHYSRLPACLLHNNKVSVLTPRWSWRLIEPWSIIGQQFSKELRRRRDHALHTKLDKVYFSCGRRISIFHITSLRDAYNEMLSPYAGVFWNQGSFRDPYCGS